MFLPEGVLLFMTKYLDINTLLTKFAVLNKNIRSKIQSNDLQG